MNHIQAQLQTHHEQYQHLTQIRIDLHYTETAKSGNQTQLAYKDIATLVNTLLSKNYITSYLWVLEFTQNEGLHAHALLYLNQQQSEALAIIVAEECWLNITEQDGLISELDIESDVISYLSQSQSKALFKSNPEHCIGIGK